MENPSVRPRLGERAVERQDRALAIVQRLLRERGIRAQRHHTIGLGLSADRAEERTGWVVPPALRCRLDRYPPELVVTGPRGRREATVTIGPRSGYYLLWLRDGSGLQNCERAEKVADLIARATATT